MISLCSITITSETKADIIGSALHSIRDIADHMLLVHLTDPAIVPDKTLKIAYKIAGKKLLVYPTAIAGTNIAGWRNYGLIKAARTGADWAVMLDTDERLILNGVDIHKTLEALPPDVDTVNVTSDDGAYHKPRFFRLPVKHAFKHGTHEDWPGKMLVLDRVRFHELEKSPEVLKQRLQGDVEGLKAQMEKEPDNPRWSYLLAKTYEELDPDPLRAIPYYAETVNLYGKDFAMRAWCSFRLAFCLRQVKQHEIALKACLQGLKFAPQHPELSWLAGLLCYEMGMNKEAIAWERMACALSWALYPATDRVVPMYLAAYFEAPVEILSLAYTELGQMEKANNAIDHVDILSKARQTFATTGRLE